MNGSHSFVAISASHYLGLVGYLGIASLMVFFLRCREGTRHEFFRGGRRQAWPLVCGSIMVSELSGASILLIPGFLLSLSGDFTWLQWAGASLIARALIGLWIVKFFYEGDFFSPYDWIGSRLSPFAKQLSSVLFLSGSVLTHAAQLIIVVAAFAMMTSWPLIWCFSGAALIGAVWTAWGGIRAVLWTDLIHLCLILIGGLVAIVWALGELGLGVGALYEALAHVETFDGRWIDKSRVFDFRAHPALESSFWVAVIASPLRHLQTLAVDQVGAQRLFSCRGPREARKAILWSSLGTLLSLVFLLLGGAIFVFYQANPPTDPLILVPLSWGGGEASAPHWGLPVWIAWELPSVLRSFLLPMILAAAISLFTSLFLALSQTSLSLMLPAEQRRGWGFEKRSVYFARALVVAWALLFASISLTFFGPEFGDDRMGRIALNAMAVWTGGPLLGIFLLALLRHREIPARGLMGGVIASVVLVFFFHPALWAHRLDRETVEFLMRWGLFQSDASQPSGIGSGLAQGWLWPLTTLVVLLSGAMSQLRIKT